MKYDGPPFINPEKTSKYAWIYLNCRLKYSKKPSRRTTDQRRAVVTEWTYWLIVFTVVNNEA